MYIKTLLKSSLKAASVLMTFQKINYWRKLTIITKQLSVHQSTKRKNSCVLHLGIKSDLKKKIGRAVFSFFSPKAFVFVLVGKCMFQTQLWPDGLRCGRGRPLVQNYGRPPSPEHKNSQAPHSEVLTVDWLCTHAGCAHTHLTLRNHSLRHLIQSFEDAVCQLSSGPDGEDGS